MNNMDEERGQGTEAETALPGRVRARKGKRKERKRYFNQLVLESEQSASEEEEEEEPVKAVEVIDLTSDNEAESSSKHETLDLTGAKSSTKACSEFFQQQLTYQPQAQQSFPEASRVPPHERIPPPTIITQPYFSVPAHNPPESPFIRFPPESYKRPLVASERRVFPLPRATATKRAIAKVDPPAKGGPKRCGNYYEDFDKGVKDPIKLPFPIQNKILTQLQRLLEKACFMFTKEHDPEQCTKQGWDCPEAIEVNYWVSEVNKSWPEALRKKVMELNGKRPGDWARIAKCASHIRHAAVHRHILCLQTLMEAAKDAIRFCEYLDLPNGLTLTVKAIRMNLAETREEYKYRMEIADKARLDELASIDAAMEEERKALMEITLRLDKLKARRKELTEASPPGPDSATLLNELGNSLNKKLDDLADSQVQARTQFNTNATGKNDGDADRDLAERLNRTMKSPLDSVFHPTGRRKLFMDSEEEGGSEYGVDSVMGASSEPARKKVRDA